MAGHEASYIELLRHRGVPMTQTELFEEKKSDEQKESGTRNHEFPEIIDGSFRDADVLSEIKSLCRADRALLETGSTAFMSFLRAYKEHQCSYIFRFQELDVGSVARAYALLRLPHIPETRASRGINFEEDRQTDTSAIPYKHSGREEARLRRLEAAKKERTTRPEPEHGADVKDERSHASGAASTTQTLQQITEPRRKRKKRVGMHQQIMEEWDELAAEEHMFRLFKKGKVDKDTYECALMSDAGPLAADDVVRDRESTGSEYEDDDDDVVAGGAATSAPHTKATQAQARGRRRGQSQLRGGSKQIHHRSPKGKPVVERGADYRRRGSRPGKRRG